MQWYASITDVKVTYFKDLGQNTAATSTVYHVPGSSDTECVFYLSLNTVAGNSSSFVVELQQMSTDILGMCAPGTECTVEVTIIDYVNPVQ